MKQSIWTNGTSSAPQAFITKGKHRLKQDGNTVYLNNNDEFEIELFNPTTTHVLAKILLDCKNISNSGIVLKPGQRVFLERYLDSNNKFVFTTYKVDGSNQQVLNAISSNGVVQIEFYNERRVQSYSNTLSWGNYNPSVTLSPPNPTFNPITYTSSPTQFGSKFTTTSSNTGTLLCDSNISYTSAANGVLNTALFSAEIETGNVEKGKPSQQVFSSSERVFDSSKFSITTWKLLPLSRKQYTPEELPSVYCTNCDYKRKKDNHKFCPNCGNKF